MKSYAIYLRKSRSDDPNSTVEETLERHEKILLETAKKMNLPISKIYREVVSGETISDRPQMQLLLDEVDKEVYSGVLVVEIERLARGNSIDQGIISQSFQLSDTKIITPNQTIDPNNEFDSENLEFGLFMSRREYKTINRRMQRGRLESVKEGKFVGNMAPFGYTRKKLENQKGFTLEISTEQAEAVRLIYNLYTEKRIGVSLIVKELDKLNIKTAKGGHWSTSTIRDILSNPVYMGKIRWNHRKQVKKVVDGKIVKQRPRSEDVVIVDGLHEAIISEETFNKAQQVLAENPSLPVPTRYKVKNPMAGLIKCGKCGRNMNRKKQKDESKAGLMCPAPQCSTVSSYLSIVEDNLIIGLKNWLDNYKLKMNNEADSDDVETPLIESSIVSMNEEIETLKTQLDSLHDLLEQGIYSTEKFVERSKLLNEKIYVLEKKKQGLEKRLSKSINKTDDDIINRIEHLLEVYYSLETPKQKNDILKDVIEKVVYNKETGGRWHANPDDFTLAIYPRLL